MDQVSGVFCRERGNNSNDERLVGTNSTSYLKNVGRHSVPDGGTSERGSELGTQRVSEAILDRESDIRLEEWQRHPSETLVGWNGHKHVITAVDLICVAVLTEIYITNERAKERTNE